MSHSPGHSHWFSRSSGPSEFDELLRSLQESGRRFLPPGLPGLGGIGPGIIVLVALLLWLGSGIYQVDPASQGVVRIFGVPQTPVDEGLHWRPPGPIGEVDVVRCWK